MFVLFLFVGATEGECLVVVTSVLEEEKGEIRNGEEEEGESEEGEEVELNDEAVKTRICGRRKLRKCKITRN